MDANIQLPLTFTNRPSCSVLNRFASVKFSFVSYCFGYGYELIEQINMLKKNKVMTDGSTKFTKKKTQENIGGSRKSQPARCIQGGGPVFRTGINRRGIP